METVIALKALSFGYGSRPLFKDLTLDIAREERRVALIGEDGAGKSTLLKLLAGLLLPSSGSVRLTTRKVGYMSQRLGLYEDLTVRENVALHLRLCGEKDPAYPFTLLERVGLTPFTERLAGALSGGMKQKLALCLALTGKPKLLILDEPTVGVDPLSRGEIWTLINEILQDSTTQCLFSTAYLEETEHCDRVLMLRNGQLTLDGAPARLCEQLRGRTFSLSLKDAGQNLRRADLRLQPDLQAAGRELMLWAGEVETPYLDICPREGRFYLLTPEVMTPESLRGKLAALMRSDPYLAAYADGGFTLTQRRPGMEDVCLNAMQESQGKEAYGERQAPAGPERERGLQEAHVSPPDEITVRHLSRRFGAFTAVESSDFEVHRGEIFALLGPNGAGKTTTFRMLCALLKPSTGEIMVTGENLFTAKAAVRARIGYVSQKFSLYGKLTVRQNLEYFALSYGLDGEEKERRLEEVSRDFGLADFYAVEARDLPFGLQRQLSMACALVHRPRILFLDEATSGADLSARRRFWKRVLGLARSGTTVIVTTHFMEEAEYCDRFLIQDAGRILILGKPAEICRDENGERLSIESTFKREVLKAREAQYAP